MTTEFDAETVVQEVSAALQRKFPDQDPARVEATVREQVDALKDKPVRDYVAVLAQRAAKKALSHPE